MDGGNVSWSDQAALPGIGELMPLGPLPLIAGSRTRCEASTNGTRGIVDGESPLRNMRWAMMIA